MTGRLPTFAALVAVLGGVALVAPFPAFATDKDIYERMTREWLIPNCDDLQCFRVVVPWVLGFLPGDGYFKWRTYAVLCQAIAALLMGRWVSRLGASERTAMQVTWLTAMGTGSLYTLFDPFTADPLMHMIAPLLMILLIDGRTRAAIAVSAVAVLGKEFAAVPLVVASLLRAQQQRWDQARAFAAGAILVTAVWGAFNIYTRSVWGYSTIHSHSDNLLSGGFIAFWLDNIGWTLAITSITAVFAGLWVLWPAGLQLGPAAVRQLTWAAIGPLLLFNYVQQPDRALWNFAFVVMPAAAVMLDRVAAPFGWALVAMQALAGLRIGAQLPFAPSLRLTLLGAIMCGFAVAARAYRQPQPALQSS